MFRRKVHKRRSSFLPFVIFRTFLSLTIFSILVFGAYSALTHFSGVDLLKGSPGAIIVSFLEEQNLKSLADQILNKTNKIKQVQIPHDEIEDIQGNAPSKKPTPTAKLAFKFMLIADSHSDNEHLRKALKQAKVDSDIKFVIGLGDYTEIGTVEELDKVKKEFDQAGVRYFLTAGDHDLWDSRDKQKVATENFSKFFGSPYQSFSYDNVRFLILYNADNYLGFGQDQLNWLSNELVRVKAEEGIKLKLAFMHEPLYHPSSTRVMGKVEPRLKDEAKNMIKTLQEAGVQEVFTGDIHYFTSYEDPESKLKMTTIGAVTLERNAQLPRYGLVRIYEDGSLEVEDIEIK